MARKQRTTRKTKVVPLFIVEGYSEEVYIKRCRSIYSQAAKIINVEGGHAKTALQRTKKEIEYNGSDYSYYVVWFDEDTYSNDSDSKLKKEVLVMGADIYMSEPCIEHWLLAHFQTINTKAKKICKTHVKALNTYIPHYKKGDQQQINRHIDEPKITIATTNYPTIGQMITTYFK